MIFLRFPAATHILRANCAETAGDGPEQSAYDIFSIERAFLRILSFDLKILVLKWAKLWLSLNYQSEVFQLQGALPLTKSASPHDN